MNKLLMTSMAIGALGAAFAGPAAAKAKIAVLHFFCAKAGCTDGSMPLSQLVRDGQGNYFGTTNGGGNGNNGVAFKASFDGTQWQVTRIHAFCAEAQCADGAAPQGGLIVDTSGNLYGATSGGGINSGGVVYKLSPSGKKWRYSVLYTFCSAANCTDGMTPRFMTLAYQGQASGVLYDGTSPLFGTTASGGNGSVAQAGAVFELTPKGKRWNETLIYSFCSDKKCNDGSVPYAGVTVDGSGNVFGVAAGGGEFQKGDNGGTVFELKPNGAHWKYSLLYTFCADRVHDICHDGDGPFAPPVLDDQGNLFGTTFRGGAKDNGVVYELSPAGKFDVLHDFCVKTGCSDGAQPNPGALVMDANGNLFGTTGAGGDATANAGIIFALTGAKHTGFAELAVFNSATGGQPYAGLILDASGDLLGTAPSGGKNAGGTIFSITP